MRIAFFADIHGNREALEACLYHSAHKDIDRYIFLGDMIGYGADPEWVLDTVMQYHENNAIVILGNHEDAVLKKPEKDMNDDARYVVEWTRARLNNTQMKFLAELPLKVQESDRLYVHASARNPDKWDYVTANFEAGQSLAATRCYFIFCGHVHEPHIFHQVVNGKVEAFLPNPGIEIPLSTRRRWLVIPGSVGQPRDGDPAACYAIYDLAQSMLTYFRVPYDVATAARKILDAGLPEWLGARLERGA